jgi:hypothetical protein
VAGDDRDVSVFLSLRYTNGEWEPNVRAVFEQLVRQIGSA